ncbi:MAG: methyltransferase domain-containing protein [Deltaproteobacteria bacterium]|nr:methyltransferase domain-containing protein [Deltaproteobacteria bacterium]
MSARDEEAVASMARTDPDLPPEEELSSDALTRDYRIWQRRRGHRYSLDDVSTAWVAARTRPSARRCVDLGCGIGSVLMMLAWKLQAASLVGIEAQATSAALARRSLGDNGIASRVRVLTGDLREVAPTLGQDFALVTGTPPYLPLGTALPSPDPQRTAARLELRGGVEAYLAAAACVVARDGRVVVCADGRYPERVVRGAEAAGLMPLARWDAMARANALTPLFSVWTLAIDDHQEASQGLSVEVGVIRDEAGQKTALAGEMRAFFGLA